MGKLKELLDREFKHLDRDLDVEAVDYSEEMMLFAEHLRGAEEIDPADFHAAVNYAVNSFGVPTEVLKAGLCSPCKGTVGRYLRGFTVPARFLRSPYLRRIADYIEDNEGKEL